MCFFTVYRHEKPITSLLIFAMFRWYNPSLHSLNTKVFPFDNDTLISYSFELSIFTVTPSKLDISFKERMFASDAGFYWTFIGNSSNCAIFLYHFDPPFVGISSIYCVWQYLILSIKYALQHTLAVEHVSNNIQSLLINYSTLLLWVKIVFAHPKTVWPLWSVSLFGLLVSLAYWQYHAMWIYSLHLKHKLSVILPYVPGNCFLPCELPWCVGVWRCVNMALMFLLKFVLIWDVVVM